MKLFRSIEAIDPLHNIEILQGTNRYAVQFAPQYQVGRASESVNPELIFWQISPLVDAATQSMTSLSHKECRSTQMPNSNDIAGSKMLWENVLSLLVVG
jgi:hypothetical protein